MKVFISWSGDRSQLLGQALNDWLHVMFGEAVEPWMSKDEIDAGKRWSPAVAGELAASKIGVLCLTPENITSPWVLFEAGALAKSLDDARVIPLLFHLDYSDITPPLSDFQAKKCDQDGIRDVVHSINRSAEKPDSEDRVNKLFDALWSELCTKIDAIPEVEAEKHRRAQHVVLEELVSAVRSLDGRFRDMERAYGEGYTQRRRARRFHPMMLHDLISETPVGPQDCPTLLVVLAGFVGDDLPWMRELLLDAARELRICDPRMAERIIENLRHMVRLFTHHPTIRELGSPYKEGLMIADELPIVLDHVLSRFEPRSVRSAPETAKVNETQK